MTRSWHKSALMGGLVLSVTYAGITWVEGEYQQPSEGQHRQALPQSLAPTQSVLKGFPDADAWYPVVATTPMVAALGSALNHELARIAAADARADVGPSVAMGASLAQATGDLAVKASVLTNPIDADTRDAAADTLFQATEDAATSFSFGPITACLDQMRSFACPIAGTIPIVKDIVGRLSMELGIYCPTGASGSKRS